MTRLDPSPQSIAELPFLIFVAVADATQSVGAAEADRFFGLLQDRGWARCPALAASLEGAAKGYADHWRRYIAGGISHRPGAVLQAVVAVAGSLSSAHAQLLEADLLHIAAVLRTAGRRPPVPQAVPLAQPFAALEAVLRESASAEAPEETPSAPLVRTPAPPVPDEPRPSQQPVGALAEPWKSVRTRVRCLRVTDETPGVRTFRFVSDPERLFCYKPGQFMTLELEIGGKHVRRNYTISSSPSRPHLVDITVKRVPGGRVSGWLHDHVAVGDILQAVIAHGKFNYWDIRAEKVLLLSAGIGITPLMSMARWQFDLCVERDTVFFHSARTPSDVVFHRELELFQGPRFKLVVTCTKPPGDEPWFGLRGRLDAAMLTTAVPDVADRVVFMCGPESWMKSTRALLAAAGHPPKNLYQESFGPRSAASAGLDSPAGSASSAGPASAAGVAAGEARIVFARSKKEVACGTDEPILDVAERSGIQIVSSCRVGACGTCRVLTTSGAVKHEHCPGLTDADAAQGYVLACSSVAEGTVVIDA